MRLTTLANVFAALALCGQSRAVCLLDDYSVEAEYHRSVAVVVANVVSERVVPDPEDSELSAGTLYPVRIEKLFRGTPRKQVDVWSENTSGRFPMENGKSYLLFLYEDEHQLSADGCGNSGLVSEKRQVLATLETLTKPGR
jgi:hypothetical protein